MWFQCSAASTCQGSADSQIVQAPIELFAQFGKRAGDVDSRGIRVQLQPQQEGLNPRVGVLAVVTVGSGDALSVVERGLGLLELPDLDECCAQACIEPPESWVVARKQRGRALQEVH